MDDQGGTRRSQLPLTTLPLNTLTPYLRARVEVTDDVLRWESPRPVLGFIPVGTQRVALPLATIGSVRSRYTVHPDRLVVGLALMLLPLLWPTWAVIVPSMLAGAVLLMMAPAAQLDVRATASSAYRLTICLRHKMDVDLVAAALEDLTGLVPHPRQQRRG
jgi:hypothetical protein